MADETISAAQSLVRSIREALQGVEQKIRRHAYLQALEDGSIEPGGLSRFVGEQSYTIPADLRSIALLISRCERPVGRQYFHDVLQGEMAALEALGKLATAVGMSPADCDAYEPTPAAQAYSAYLASLCLYGADAEVAAALSLNFAAWGANCGRMAEALRRRYGLREADLRFFSQFATAPSDVSPQALELIADGLRRGVEAKRILRAARMLQGYELLFWDTIYVLSASSEG